jgi:hypothetical protein
MDQQSDIGHMLFNPDLSSACQAQDREGPLTLCQEVQFIDEESLILRPSEVERLWRQ